MYNDVIESWTQDGVECNLYVDYGGDMFDPRGDDSLGIFVCREHRSYHLPQEVKGFRFEDFDSLDEAIEHLKTEHNAIHIHPVWMYDHSGVSYSMGESNPYSCQWDSSLCGVIFTTEKQMDYLGVTDRSDKKIQKWLDDEIEEYSSWASGNVYYYVIDAPDGQGDGGCGGLIGYEYACEEAQYALKWEAEDYVERAVKEKNEREHWAARDVITA